MSSVVSGMIYRAVQSELLSASPSRSQAVASSSGLFWEGVSLENSGSS